MRTINEIIVHCTATFPEQVVTVSDLARWHRQRGFKEIGYHFVINQQGEIFDGRAIEKQGAHCLGHNANSIGVCYVGGLNEHGKPADTRTDAQKASLISLLRKLKEQFPGASIHGHNEFSNKACPCFNAFEEYKEL
jgi:N-acetylmuramoyl-L-alanine amidase